VTTEPSLARLAETRRVLEAPGHVIALPFIAVLALAVDGGTGKPFPNLRLQLCLAVIISRVGVALLFHLSRLARART